MSDSLPKLSLPQSTIFRFGPNFGESSGTRRFRVVVAGRRFGKTFLSLWELISTACRYPGCEVWYVAPTYKMAKRIAWRSLKEFVPSEFVQSTNETDLMMEFVNKAVLRLMGAEDPKSLVGSGVKGAVVDEYASTKEELWGESLRPALADQEGWALFIGTPRGFNHFYDLYTRAEDPEFSANWGAWTFTTEDGGNVSSRELAAAAHDMNERVYRQEFMASFEAMSGRVYHSFDRHVNISDEAEDNNRLPLLVGMDFNRNPMTALLAVQRGDECHVFDEVELYDSNTFEMANTISKRYLNREPYPDERTRDMELSNLIQFTTQVTRDIVVYPDPTCNQRQTNAAAGVTDLTILKEAGFATHLPPTGVYPIMDRVNTVNAAFCNAAGQRKLYVHPRCRKLIKCLDGQILDDRGKPSKEDGLDHAPDALGYLVCGAFSQFSTKVRSVKVNV